MKDLEINLENRSGAATRHSPQTTVGIEMAMGSRPHLRARRVDYNTARMQRALNRHGGGVADRMLYLQLGQRDVQSIVILGGPTVRLPVP